MKKTFVSVSCALILIFSFVFDAQALSYTVYAQANSSSGGSGLDTGLNLSFGQLFSVSVDPNDLWSAGALPRWSNADGLTGNLYATGSDESGQPAGTLIGQNFGSYTQSGLSAPYGSLVGEIAGTYFLLGTNFSGAAPASGMLKLYYWDSNNWDNTNQLDFVHVRIATPEPATMLLLGLGLIGIAGVRRFRQ